MKIDGTYKNGNPFNGLFKGEFYFDGEKAEEKINYFSDGGTTAEISSKGLTIKNGNIKIGQWNFYHKDGSKKSRGRYDNNKKNGEWVYWYKSGDKENAGVFNDDLKNGKWEGWYFSGQKFYERSYVLDKKEGEWIWWYSNGKMKYKGLYLNDKKDGKFAIFSKAY